jgi:hypothetical protein
MDKLKYSQLLRLGRQKVKPIRHQWFTTDDGHTIVGACVIGMIAVAKTGSLNLLECQATLNGLLDELNNQSQFLSSQMVDLYEAKAHKKSPEEVADWLEAKGL